MSSVSQNYNQQPPNPNSDEIDLGELLANIWATRGKVLVSVLVVLALFACYVGVSYLTSYKTVRYSNVFDLNFEGLSKGEFPNGSRFQMSDITSNAVLNRVYHQNNLDQYGLKLDGFRRSVSIQPYAPNAEFIREKYQARLADKKLTTAEITDLENELARELKAARSSSVRLSLVLPEAHSLPNDVAEKVLLDISQVWADRAINEVGVLKPAVSVYSERIFNQARFENLDYLLGINLVLESIDLVRGNIAALMKQPNATTLVDDQTGFTLADLDKAIKDIAEYDIRQIVDPIDELGIARNEEVVRLHYSRRLSDLKREKEMWLERASAIKEVLKGYTQDSSKPGEYIAGAQNNLVPQLGDAFLDRLLEVSRQGSDLEFRQKLTLEMLAFENKAIDVEQKIETVRRTLATIDGKLKKSDELRSVYIQVVEEQLPVVLKQLREYANIMNRLYDKQGHQVAGNVSELISPEGGSYAVSSAKIINKSQLRVLAILLALAVIVTIFITLVMQAVRNRKAYN